MPLQLSAFPKCYLDKIAGERSMTVFEWIEMAGSLDADGLARIFHIHNPHTIIHAFDYAFAYFASIRSFFGCFAHTFPLTPIGDFTCKRDFPPSTRFGRRTSWTA